SETRIALDLQHLLKWIDQPGADVPSTIVAAGFQSSRLETMRSRTSAAYRGLYVLLQQRGAEDFFWKARIMDIDRNEKGIDIHHIFPRKWCDDRKIAPKVYNSIINKTAISYRGNRKIGGNAPSDYLTKLEADPAVQLTSTALDAILATHSIAPNFLRSDDFDGFFAERKSALLRIIIQAMGKPAIDSTEPVADDEMEDEEEATA
ncbi:MAG: hypothetical protein ABL893_11465, partial [Hyphomicrobium sp.]